MPPTPLYTAFVLYFVLVGGSVGQVDLSWVGVGMEGKGALCVRYVLHTHNCGKGQRLGPVGSPL